MALITTAQFENQTRRIAAFLDSKANKIDMLSREELEIICASRPLEFSAGCVGLMNKYGLNLKTHSEYYAQIGDNWTIEFFIKLKNSLAEYPDAAAMHFAILDSNGDGLALGLSKNSASNGHPCESFFLGNIDSPTSAVYFDSLDATIADGARHHICIEHYLINAGANVAVYVDGALVVANHFDTAITDFTNLVFGADAFADTPCVKNFAIFDRIRILGECKYLLAGSAIQDTIAIPSAFELGESTLVFYQNGLLNVFVEDAEIES